MEINTVSLVFSTGVTPNFLPRAEKLWPSIRQHRIPFLVHLVDFADVPPCFAGIPTVRVRYADVRCRVPKTQLQHGAHTQFHVGPESDVVAFVDGDAYFARPPTAEEIELFESVGENEFMAGRNSPDPKQTLANEATLIGPKVTQKEIERLWHGAEQMLCRNFGFVVARVSTWRKIYKGFIARWPDADRCWTNPAVVQWLSLWSAYSQGMKCTLLDPTVHNHGHLGLVPGSELIDGAWHWNGKQTLFVHAL